MSGLHDSPAHGISTRVWRFLRKPAHDKASALYFRWLRVFPFFPVPFRLPFGALWLARNDACSLMILDGSFENDERQFAERFLQPGMTVLDIGAHHGYYSLLASRKTGSTGKVFAFEPSSRERKRLMRHLRLNRASNVTVEGIALGNTCGEAELFLVDGAETGCNSLRPPSVEQPTYTHRVQVQKLDDYLEQRGITQVDFVKLDVEGGELEVLHGAGRFLSRVPRPVILAEVQDIRTRPWGYAAKEIIAFLSSRGFVWYRPLPGGKVEQQPQDLEEYEGNFIAVPDEQADAFRKRLGIEAAI